MAAALVVPISGPYLAAWGGNNNFPSTGGAILGTQGDDGFILSCSFQGQEVNASDAYGLTLVEAIWRGQNWRCRFTGLEWDKAGLLNLQQMFNAVQPGTGLFQPRLANIGDRWSKFCSALQLTAILAQPPTYPFSLTALTAGLAPNSQTSWMMTSKLREMPLEMVLLPFATTILTIPVIVPFIAA